MDQYSIFGHKMTMYIRIHIYSNIPIFDIFPAASFEYAVYSTLAVTDLVESFLSLSISRVCTARRATVCLSGLLPELVPGSTFYLFKTRLSREHSPVAFLRSSPSCCRTTTPWHQEPRHTVISRCVSRFGLIGPQSELYGVCRGTP